MQELNTWWIEKRDEFNGQGEQCLCGPCFAKTFFSQINENFERGS